MSNDLNKLKRVRLFCLFCYSCGKFYRLLCNRLGVPNQRGEAPSQGVRDGLSDFCVALLYCHALFNLC